MFPPSIFLYSRWRPFPVSFVREKKRKKKKPPSPFLYILSLIIFESIRKEEIYIDLRGDSIKFFLYSHHIIQLYSTFNPAQHFYSFYYCGRWGFFSVLHWVVPLPQGVACGPRRRNSLMCVPPTSIYPAKSGRKIRKKNQNFCSKKNPFSTRIEPPLFSSFSQL